MSSWGQGESWANQKARKKVLERDGHCCQLMLDPCIGRASQAHHIHGLQGRRRHDAADPDEMIAVCKPCHDIITEQQRKQAWEAKQRYRNQRRRLPVKPHPGD